MKLFPTTQDFYASLQTGMAMIGPNGVSLDPPNEKDEASLKSLLSGVYCDDC